MDGTSGDIDFDVVDTAENIAAEIVGAGKSDDELDNAEVVIVSGGDVDVIEASAIQNIHKYAEYSSHYDITDDADNILALSSGSPVLQVSGDVTALNVDSKENALALKNNYDVDNFTLDTSAILTQLSADNASVDEALALLQSSSGASNGLTDESVISITDTVGNLDSNFHDLKTGGSLENVANVKATLASVGDAEAFVGDLQVPPTGASYYNSELSSLVDEFELSSSMLGSVSNFENLSVSEALSVLQATNAASIPSITIEDTYDNLTQTNASLINSGLSIEAVPTILANGITVSSGISPVNFTFKDVHVKDVSLTQAIDLNNNYPNVNFSYSLLNSEFSSSNFTDATIDEAVALVGATNFPGTSILTINDTALICNRCRW